VTDVKNAIIWGNHSSTQYPDVNHGTVAGTPIREAVKDDDWLNGDFISTVQQRGAAIIKVGSRLLPTFLALLSGSMSPFLLPNGGSHALGDRPNVSSVTGCCIEAES
jgi:hypothetical protein